MLRCRRQEGTVLAKEPGGVVPWRNGVTFRCPCGKRLVHIALPPHKTAEFDANGLLTVDPSIGSKPNPHRDRPENWCHFWVKAGEVEMASDAQCPGKQSP